MSPELPPAVSATINWTSRLRAQLGAAEALAVVGHSIHCIRERRFARTLSELLLEGRLLTGSEFEAVALQSPGAAEISGAVRVPFERIPAEVLTPLIGELHHALLAAPAELAEALATWWYDARDFAAHRYFSIPAEIAHTMLALSRTEGQAPLYCLGEPADGIALESLRQGETPTVFASRPPLMAQVYAAILEQPLKYVREESDSVATTEYLKAQSPERILAVPAIGPIPDTVKHEHFFGLPYRSRESLALDIVTRSLKGVGVVLVPHGILFRRGPELGLRQHLVRSGILRAVVSFPSGLLRSTSIPFSLLVLDTRCDTGDIIFCQVDPDRHVDTVPGMLKSHVRRFTGEQELLRELRNPSGEWCRAISRATVLAGDSLLSVNRYLTSSHSARHVLPHQRLVRLGDVAEIVKPQGFRSRPSKDFVLVGEVGPGELPAFDYVRTATRQRQVESHDRDRLCDQILRADDVLLSTKGTIGRSGIAQPDKDEGPISASQSLVILRPLPSAGFRDAKSLLMYLRSPAFQKQLRARVVGSTIPNVPLSELKGLEIALPSAEEQASLAQTFDAQIELQTKVDEFQEQQRIFEELAWKQAGLNGG